LEKIIGGIREMTPVIAHLKIQSDKFGKEKSDHELL